LSPFGVGRLGFVETGRRRRWTDDEKLKVVAESMEDATSDLVDDAAVAELAMIVLLVPTPECLAT